MLLGVESRWWWLGGEVHFWFFLKGLREGEGVLGCVGMNEKMEMGEIDVCGLEFGFRAKRGDHELLGGVGLVWFDMSFCRFWVSFCRGGLEMGRKRDKGGDERKGLFLVPGGGGLKGPLCLFVCFLLLVF